MAEFLRELNWSDETIQLKRLKEHGITTPCLVQIVDSGNESLPSRLTQEPLLLYNIICHKKVISQCVEHVGKDGSLDFSAQRYSIPLAYPGWFEILSEDGKTVVPCKTVEQIAQKGLDKFLVRSNVKAFTSEVNGDPNYDKSKTVHKGEIMSIVDQTQIIHGWRKQKKNILHCLDSNGIDIYFDFKASGQFSPLAGSSTISGVHSIEDLVDQFRLPLTVRIVSGQIPRAASENDRPGVFRLIESQTDTTALFMPTKSSPKLLPVSIRMNLNMQIATNPSEFSRNQSFQKLLTLTQLKVEKYLQTMQILVSTNQTRKTYDALTLPSRRKPIHAGGSNQIKQSSNSNEEDLLFAEVDDLYAYVRRGGTPPRPRPRSWATNIDVTSLFNQDTKFSSNPVLTSPATGKPRGLLATLTAGKFPTKGNMLIKQYKVPTTKTEGPTSPQTTSPSTETLPTVKFDKVKAYMDKYQGSVESLLQTEVDPTVDETHYQNFETIEATKRGEAIDQKKSIVPSVQQRIFHHHLHPMSNGRRMHVSYSQNDLTTSS